MISTKYTGALLLRRSITSSGTCSNKLSSPFSGDATYRGGLPNAIFLKGSSGDYDNMNMDCDGANNSAGRYSNLGRRNRVKRPSRATVSPNLNANVHTQVVFGNEGASPSFNPQSKVMEPLSVTAIECNNEVVFFIRNSGDTNDFTSTGEAFLALVQIERPKTRQNSRSASSPWAINPLPACTSATLFEGIESLPFRHI
ncbi:hypothetical protein TRIATDRAFT_197013 [Trichoderma atroviride IMI 206040]|uniref:Endo-chitosanase n=1 Tax=Hypocrea atroviridis (strain ATCC 20476 / IMI 206040) TaxID=452589 RepID=G9NTR0_HYPAI|nr:uncharacterized protein TRIATDRAFT_197013 [Trichoderma atroviride IMI 206040]EHK46099.1 hypothetical protein TRIATDRAFT_197013 [Trichoderma atroviride IMI 206040]